MKLTKAGFEKLFVPLIVAMAVLVAALKKPPEQVKKWSAEYKVPHVTVVAALVAAYIWYRKGLKGQYAVGAVAVLAVGIFAYLVNRDQEKPNVLAVGYADPTECGACCAGTSGGPGGGGGAVGARLPFADDPPPVPMHSA